VGGQNKSERQAKENETSQLPLQKPEAVGKDPYQSDQRISIGDRTCDRNSFGLQDVGQNLNIQNIDFNAHDSLGRWKIS
jgi:hypothetical protein